MQLADNIRTIGGAMPRLAPLLLCLTIVLTSCGKPAVPDSPGEVRPLLPGMEAPAFTALDPANQVYRFRPGEQAGPIVLTFYRGGWCPYCSKHLMAFREVEAELVDMGYEVLFVSPDRPEVSAAHLGDSEFEFTLLSDSDMEIARAYGLAFRLDDETFRKYTEEYGFDLEGDSGQTHHWLPVPATYIIGADGVVRFMYANPDYKIRLAPELLRTAARLALE